MFREVVPGRLFLGNASEARDLRLLHDHDIAAVVDLAIDEPPAQLAREMIYCRIPLMDGDSNSDALIETAIRCVASLISRDFRTLLACSGGMSRSPVIAAAAMALIFSQKSLESHLSAILAGAPQEVSPGLWPSVKRVLSQLDPG